MGWFEVKTKLRMRFDIGLWGELTLTVNLRPCVLIQLQASARAPRRTLGVHRILKKKLCGAQCPTWACDGGWCDRTLGFPYKILYWGKKKPLFYHEPVALWFFSSLSLSLSLSPLPPPLSLSLSLSLSLPLSLSLSLPRSPLSLSPQPPSFWWGALRTIF